jgi:DNA-directed RNA polymerase specialized sigma24 family protein
MDCVPRPGPTDEQIREIMEVAEKAARAVGARGDVLEDVRQITVSKLIARWHTPSVIAARKIGGRRWRGYVGITARHAYFDILRSNGRRRRRERLGFDLPSPMPRRPGTHRSDDGPRSEIDDFLAQEIVKNLIEEYLSGVERIVAWGLFVEGTSINELAEELGKAPRTTRAYKQAAIQKLRAVVRPKRPDEDDDEDDGRD